MSVLLTFQESIASEMQFWRNFISDTDLFCATFGNSPRATIWKGQGHERI